MPTGALALDPDKGIWRGDPAALLVIVRASAKLPAVAGANVTEMVHEAPGANEPKYPTPEIVVPQVFVLEKAGVALVMPVIPT